MLDHRKNWLTLCLLLAGSLFLPGAYASAGEKKAASKFTAKAIELKLKDGKQVHATELTENDAKALGRFHYKVFTVQFEKDKMYRIDHRAGDAFDAYLFLEDADGVQLDVDDDGAGGFNSRIVHKAAKTGTYRIITTTLRPNQTGKFTLDIGAPDAKDMRLFEIKLQMNSFAKLTPAQQKKLVADVNKYLADKNGDLTGADFQLAFTLGSEAEFESVALAREVYKEAVKQFSAAKDEKISSPATDQFEKALRTLDKLGKPIEITGKTTDGKDFDLTKMKGKVVLVDFWATWCGPCINELPNMEQAYAKYHSKGFDIIGISLDRVGDEDKLSKFMADRKMPWPCINIEDSRKLADLHKVNSIPYPVLVDREGRVVSFRARGPALERMLARLLAEKK